MGRVRTCFASSVVHDDYFLELPLASQAAYFQLAFDADSDGAIDGFKRLIRSYGCNDGDIVALFRAGYLIDVGGVVFIRHWCQNNLHDPHNYRPGGHPDELKRVFVDWKHAYESPPGESLSSDVKKTDGSLTPAVYGNIGNDREPYVNESNFNELNSTEPDLIEKNPAPQKVRFEPCPQCGTPCAIVEQSGKLHGFCDSCGDDFFVSPDGDYL